MKKRLLIILMVIAILMLPVMDAFAAGSVRYIKSPNGKKVNVRTGPSEKGYAVASQLEPGTEVNLISSSKGWAKIRVNGFVVYVKTKYLTTKAP